MRLRPYRNRAIRTAWHSLGCLRSLTHLTLTGHLPDLPDAWAQLGSFPALLELSIISSNLGGSLPTSWSQSSAFPELVLLNITTSRLSGTLPASWGQDGSFRKLSAMSLTGNQLTGTLSFCDLNYTDGIAALPNKVHPQHGHGFVRTMHQLMRYLYLLFLMTELPKHPATHQV